MNILLNRLFTVIGAAVVMFTIFLLPDIRSEAAQEDTISSGIYAEHISLEGMSEAQAKKAIEDYIKEVQGRTIILKAVEDNEVGIPAADLGITWSNQDIVKEAAAIGQTGNIVKRYKAIKDLERENKVFSIELSFDKEAVLRIVQEQCAVFNIEAKDATLQRVDGNFTVSGGQTGYVVDEDASVTAIMDYLNESWQGDGDTIELVVKVSEPRGNEEELLQVKDVLGTFTTSFSSSGTSRSANVSNGANLINGTTLYPGDEFSSYQTVSPFSAENGYYMAGSYLNGQVVDSIGGGICQVTTTLYNAVLLSELEVTERHNHSMIVSYVKPSEDAAIAESAGKDFKFVNNLDHPIYIEGYTTPEKNISFTIYGVETRAANRTVEYVSEIISTTYPDTEVIYTSEAHPAGYVSVQSSHTGYKANLWKVVKENDVEVSREQINSSSYKMVPRNATVGIATEDPNIYNQITAAIATNNIDHVKNVAAQFAPAPPAAEEQPVEGGEAQVPPPEAPPAQEAPPEGTE